MWPANRRKSEALLCSVLSLQNIVARVSYITVYAHMLTAQIESQKRTKKPTQRNSVSEVERTKRMLPMELWLEHSQSGGLRCLAVRIHKEVRVEHFWKWSSSMHNFQSTVHQVGNKVYQPYSQCQCCMINIVHPPAFSSKVMTWVWLVQTAGTEKIISDGTKIPVVKFDKSILYLDKPWVKEQSVVRVSCKKVQL